jgi:hypothetical protein
MRTLKEQLVVVVPANALNASAKSLTLSNNVAMSQLVERVKNLSASRVLAALVADPTENAARPVVKKIQNAASSVMILGNVRKLPYAS